MPSTDTVPTADRAPRASETNHASETEVAAIFATMFDNLPGVHSRIRRETDTFAGAHPHPESGFSTGHELLGYVSRQEATPGAYLYGAGALCPALAFYILIKTTPEISIPAPSSLVGFAGCCCRPSNPK